MVDVRLGMGMWGYGFMVGVRLLGDLLVCKVLIVSLLMDFVGLRRFCCFLVFYRVSKMMVFCFFGFVVLKFVNDV